MIDPSGKPQQADPVAPPRPRSWIRRVAVALAALALLFLGAAGGQLLWPRQVVVQQVDANDHDPETVTMPHVLGLPEQDARAAIADAGYTQTITTTQRAAAGDPGSVLRQTPAPQAVIDSSTAIELVVSTPAAMPDLVASTQQLAQAEVERLGGAAQFVTVVDASHSPGTILSTEPSAGEAMPQIVRLRVASGGVALPLTDLSPLERDRCSSTSNALIDGRTFASSLVCTPRAGSPARATYAVSRKAGYLRFTLGVPDRANDTHAIATVTVVVDDKVALREEARFGTSQQHTVPLSDALRMEILVEAAGKDARPEVAFGDVALMGLATDLDQLR